MTRTGRTLLAIIAVATASMGSAATHRRSSAQQAKAGPAAMRFDLECSGMLHNWTGEAPASWKEIFKVDMSSNRWCRGRCGTTYPIGTMNTDMLALHDSHAGTGGPTGVETTISRMDGEIKERLSLGTPAVSKVVVEGFCTKTPFTGFGERKF